MILRLTHPRRQREREREHRGQDELPATGGAVVGERRVYIYIITWRAVDGEAEILMGPISRVTGPLGRESRPHIPPLNIVGPDCP